MRSNRSTHHDHRRDAAELIVNRAAWLPDPDRRLLLAIYRDGHKVADLANLMRIPASTLRGRARRLVRHLFDPTVCLVARERRRWPDTTRRVAESCFLERRSVRDTAAQLGLSYHTVRKQRDAVIALTTNATSTRATR